MKQIKNSSAWKLSLLLIPVVVVCIAAIILKTFPGWGVVTGIVSVVAYMGAMTYFCIKQKCYGQLAQSYAFILMWVVIYIIQQNIAAS